MSVTYEALEDLIAMLKDNWTYGQPPEITALWKSKSVGFVDDRRDRILIVPRRENIEYFSMAGTDFLHTVTLAIDCRSYGEQDKMSENVIEILRILKANIRRTGFVDVLIKNATSRSDNLRNMFKHEIVVQYRKHYDLE
tara:strand:- start:133 stop:549 length:417 start_codon:yes stop_codon:yes gene_type:complete